MRLLGILILLLTFTPSFSQYQYALIPYKKGKLYGYASRITKDLVIFPKYEEANLFSSNGRALIKIKGKYGFINDKGDYVIFPQYKEAFEYKNNNCTFVKDKNDVYSLLDSAGNVLASGFEEIQYTSTYFEEGYHPVKMNGKWGVIDTAGKTIIPCSYWAIADIRQGYIVAKNNSSDYGVLTIDGKTLLDFGFKKIYINPGEPVIRIETKEGKEGFFTKDKKIILESGSSFGEFHEGLAHVKKDGKYGFIDSLGNTIMPPQFENVSWFNEGLCTVKKGRKWGAIDKKGNAVIPFEYNHLSEISNGLCQVEVKGLEGYINSKGEIIITPQFDKAYPFYGSNVTLVEKERKLALVTKEGKLVTDFSYDIDKEKLYVPKDTIVWLKKGEKFGLLSIHGKELTEFVFTDFKTPSHGITTALKPTEDNGTKWGVLNSEGKEIIPFIFTDITIYDNEKIIQGVIGKGAPYKPGKVYMETDGYKYFE